MPNKDIPKTVFIKNIFKSNYTADNITDDAKAEIHYHESAALRKREDNGMTICIYLPIEHPIIKASLIKKGRIIEWREYDTKYRHTVCVTSHQIITDKELVNDFSNDNNVLHSIKYDGGSYYKITAIYLNDEPIIRLQGYSTKRKEYEL